MRCTASGRTRMLASEATTPSFTSNETRSASTRCPYNKRKTTKNHDKMSAAAAFRLQKVAEAAFPTRWGSFRIFGFAGLYPDRLAEAVVLEVGDVPSAD